MESCNKLNADDVDFPFPFKPYSVQLDFMKNIYTVLAESKIGIFESPTGTGKSLSIICGALKWLKDYQKSRKETLKRLMSEIIIEDEADWISSYSNKLKKLEQIKDAKDEYEFIEAYENKIQNLRKLAETSAALEENNFGKHLSKKLKKDETPDEDMTSNDEYLTVDDFNLNIDEDDDSDNDEESTEAKHQILKIFYSSRTHSQLAQFAGELKKSPFGRDITVTTLGSRANLCVNASVNKLKSLSLINDKCTELQKSKKVSKDLKKTKLSSCPFFLQSKVQNLTENILVTVRDIEELVELGREIKACPYYASRYSIPNVEIVLLPYNTLLHKSMREANGIDLKNNILIIDEAHNLLEAINNMHSSEISYTYLFHAQSQLTFYRERYSSRFAARTLLFIKQLNFILTAFLRHLKEKTLKAKNEKSDNARVMSHKDFVNAIGITDINFFDLIRFCEQSQIGRKLHGFAIKRNLSNCILPVKSQIEPGFKPSSTIKLLNQIKNIHSRGKSDSTQVPNSKDSKEANVSPSAFITFYEFLKTFTLPSGSGHFIVNKQDTLEKSSIKFLHLNPSIEFQDIVSNTRSIVLAGGTMQPISEFIDQLLVPAGARKEEIIHFSCNHVIPPDNLLAIALSEGPSKKVLDFTYKSRYDPEIISELGNTLVNLCTIVPAGVVCFLPSYDYEEIVFTHFKKTNILTRIEKKKVIFREPKQSGDVEAVLANYSKCIYALSKSLSSSKQSGALLFSIVGGKMSEGINFSDDLCRCVVMVGLPYPNKFSLEIKEKMAYFNKMSGTASKPLGDIYYENLCLKAVNQSIGRAIRHKNDYAVIVLADHRYKRSSVKDGLPAWIRERFSSNSTFGHSYLDIRNFFKKDRSLVS